MTNKWVNTIAGAALLLLPQVCLHAQDASEQEQRSQKPSLKDLKATILLRNDGTRASTWRRSARTNLFTMAIASASRSRAASKDIYTFCAKPASANRGCSIRMAIAGKTTILFRMASLV